MNKRIGTFLLVISNIRFGSFIFVYFFFLDQTADEQYMDEYMKKKVGWISRW